MVSGGQVREQFADTRALDCDATEIRTATLDLDVAPQMFFQPIEIFIHARCIDDEQKLRVADPVGDQVVDDSTFVV
jgi:hypothetical protein